MENEFSNRISVKNIVLAGMFAAFLAVMSQVSLPMPTGVPILSLIHISEPTRP